MKKNMYFPEVEITAGNRRTKTEKSKRSTRPKSESQNKLIGKSIDALQRPIYEKNYYDIQTLSYLCPKFTTNEALFL